MNFQLINQYGSMVEDNKLFTQYHDSQMTNRYDSNYISFKQVPMLVEFLEVEKYLKSYHQTFNQQHLKFCFPENKKLPQELIDYLIEQEYSIGSLEMYKIVPSNFKGIQKQQTNIQYVSEGNWEQYSQLQYAEDLRFGEGFAKAKQSFLKRISQLDNWKALIVFDEEDHAIGSLELIIKEQTVEIDNLFIVEHKQKLGYGTQLQTFVMEQFPTKTIILVADGEDSPKEMYKKQGYEYVGKIFEILKVENEERL